MGQRIYDYWEGYQLEIEIPVTASGLYWSAAYAKDEAGSIIRSSPRPVFVAILPMTQAQPEGSHGAPPSYTGTDEDFLKPAGDPHFASLKDLSLLDTHHFIFGSALGFFESASPRRAIGSTSRDEVLARLSEPLQIGSLRASPDPAAIAAALDRLDRFVFSSFPRVRRFDAEGVGRCDDPKTYFPPEVSGKLKIIAETLNFGKAEKKLSVQVSGLILLPEDGPPLLTWRSTGKIPGLHTDNHWGTSHTKITMQLVARDSFETFGATLGINDMSLPQGGLFDIAGDWRPDHNWHRVGTSVDVDRTACVDPTLQGACQKTQSVDRILIGKLCTARGQGFLARERKVPPPIHCEFRQ